MTGDLAGDIGTTGVLSRNLPLAGQLDVSGDRDWFRITLEAGQGYGVSVLGDTQSNPVVTGFFSNSGDPLVSAENGDAISSDFLFRDGNANSRYFVAPSSGDFFVEVASRDGSTTGDYNAFLFRDDNIGNAQDAQPLQLEVPQFGTIDGPRDQDWFSFDAEVGKVYRFQIYGQDAGFEDLTLPNAFLFLLNENGNRFNHAVTSAPSPSGSGATYTATQSGTVYISTHGGKGFAEFAETGSYRVIVKEVLPENGAAIENSFEIQPDQPFVAEGALGVRGPLGRTDVDWFHFDVSAGQSYRVRVDGNAFLRDFTRNQDSRILDADGNTVSEFSRLPGLFDGAFQTEFTAATSGIHYLRTAHTQSDGVYEVTLQELADVRGIDGSDWLTLPASGNHRLHSIDGGAGQDMMSFSGLDAGILVNLSNGLARFTDGADPFELTMQSIENVTGTSHNDTLYGHDGSEKIRGLGGRDVIYGSAGARDTIDGGASNDLLDYIGSDSGVSVSLLRGRGWGGDAQGDRIAGIEGVAGSNHDDFIWGDHGDNRLEGRHGDDTLVGNGGDDYILAGHGHDMVVYSGNQADYTITRDGLRTEVIHNNDGWDGHDIIGHAEVLRFADGDLVL